MERAQRPTIDSAEAARRLRTSARSISCRAKRGSIPRAFKVGRCIEFDEATFEAWRRENGDPNALPADHFSVDPLPFGEDADKGEGDAA